MLTTVFTTLITGILIFAFSQMFVVLFLERIRMQGRAVEEIAQALFVYAPYLRGSIQGESEERRQVAQDELRRLAALLRATAQTLKWYLVWQSIRVVLPRNDVLEASKGVLYLSNSCFAPYDNRVTDTERRVKDLLRIHIEPAASENRRHENE